MAFYYRQWNDTTGLTKWIKVLGIYLWRAKLSHTTQEIGLHIKRVNVRELQRILTQIELSCLCLRFFRLMSTEEVSILCEDILRLRSSYSLISGLSRTQFVGFNDITDSWQLGPTRKEDYATDPVVNISLILKWTSNRVGVHFVAYLFSLVFMWLGKASYFR